MRADDRAHDREVKQRADDGADGLDSEGHARLDLGVLALARV